VNNFAKCPTNLDYIYKKVKYFPDITSCGLPPRAIKVSNALGPLRISHRADGIWNVSKLQKVARHVRMASADFASSFEGVNTRLTLTLHHYLYTIKGQFRRTGSEPNLR